MKLMLRLSGIIILAVLMPGNILAQDVNLKKGMDSFQAGDYQKALEYYTISIRDEKELTSEMLAQAYYYRGLTYVRLYNQAFSGDDLNLKKSYNDALLLAYQDYRTSLNHSRGELWKPIDLEMKNLHQPLLQEGLKTLNQYNQSVYEGKPDKGLLKRAEDYLTAAHEIRESYLVCDLLGQVYLDKGLKEEAAVYFEKAEKLYTEKLPPEPDFMMAYVFYRLAAIHKSQGIRLALQDNQRGINLMESEYSRYLLMKDSFKTEKAARLEKQYQLGMKDLNALKLDLYLSDTSLYVEALHVFKEEMSEKPNDINIMTSYASLLEKSDREEALKIYQSILAIDSVNSIALFNSGALHYAKGKDLLETARTTSDESQYAILIQNAHEEFSRAGNYFERALKTDPESLEIVNALKTIAFVLDDKTKYLLYQEMERKLTQ